MLTAWLDIAAPYHEFAAQFFKNAADPDEPAQPLLPRVGARPRRRPSSVHREVLAGAKTKVPDELADVLPELMWLSQMGLVLYWVFDRSPDSERTRRLAERGAQLTTRGIVLARFRVLRPLVREVHELFTDFLPGMAQTAVGRKRASGARTRRRDTGSPVGPAGAVTAGRGPTAGRVPGGAGRRCRRQVLRAGDGLAGREGVLCRIRPGTRRVPRR